MHCIKGMYECNGCGWCGNERCEICGARTDVVYYGGVAYCRSCGKKQKKGAANVG